MVVVKTGNSARQEAASVGAERVAVMAATNIRGSTLPARATYTCPVPTGPSHAPTGFREYRGSWGALFVQLTLRALVNPRLALDLLKTGWAFRRRNWWSRAPWLPIPDRTYLRWRMYTAYADEDAVPPVHDVIRFARWRRTTMGM